METYYKLVPTKDLKSILKNGLVPSSKEINGIKGNWSINERYIKQWLIHNEFFGSALQALLFFPSKKNDTISLIKFESNNKSYIRDVDLMFNDKKKYMVSFKEYSENNYKIIESLVLGNIKNVTHITTFICDNDFSNQIAEPLSLWKFLLNGDKSKIQWTGKISMLKLVMKMISYKIKNLIP